jgi:hypothetical protein
VGYSLPFEKIRQFPGDAHRRLPVPESGRANLNGAGPGDQELGGIQAGRDSTQANYGNLHGPRRLAYQPQGDGLDGGTGKSPETGADAGTAGVRIDGQRDTRVDQRKGVGAARFRRLRQGFDGADIR